MDGSARWLDDMGTGSYVDPSLHWYRSTLAHNAPLLDGKSLWTAADVDGMVGDIERNQQISSLPSPASYAGTRTGTVGSP